MGPVEFRISDARRALQAAPDADDDGPGGAAKRLLRLARAKTQPADAPGVYEAPEKPGFNGLQFLVTVGLGAVALVIGMVLVSALLGAGINLTP